jgi:hypothetical protein
MGRIITILGLGLCIYSAKLTWAIIELPGWLQKYNGFSQENLFGDKPGFLTLMIAGAVLILAIINKKITQLIALAGGVFLLGRGLMLWFDLKNNFATQDGFTLSTGLYLHALAPLIVIGGIVLTLSKLRKAS